MLPRSTQCHPKKSGLARIAFDGHPYAGPNVVSAYVESPLSVLKAVAACAALRVLARWSTRPCREAWISAWLCVLVSLVIREASTYGGLNNFGRFKMLYGTERAAKRIPGSQQTGGQGSFDVIDLVDELGASPHGRKHDQHVIGYRTNTPSNMG